MNDVVTLKSGAIIFRHSLELFVGWRSFTWISDLQGRETTLVGEMKLKAMIELLCYRWKREKNRIQLKRKHWYIKEEWKNEKSIYRSLCMIEERNNKHTNAHDQIPYFRTRFLFWLGVACVSPALSGDNTRIKKHRVKLTPVHIA